jgi:hypothetical protein
MKKTDIEWCDSTLNLEMGCDGCELWNRKNGIKHCYAGLVTDIRKGRDGWPEAFELPKIFPNRLPTALGWPDLTRQSRPEFPSGSRPRKQEPSRYPNVLRR